MKKALLTAATIAVIAAAPAAVACEAPRVTYLFVGEAGEAFPGELVEVTVYARACVTMTPPPKRGEIPQEPRVYWLSGQYTGEDDGEAVRGNVYVAAATE